MNAKTPKELQPGATHQRGLSLIERAVVDEAARTATLAFSSEAPVERSWGIEILDHSTKSMRVGRLASGGPLLMDHDTRDHVGVIESVQIGADRVARAVVRFGRSARAEEVFRDVVDGIRRNVSVGYVIHEARLEGEQNGVQAYRVSDWEPYEISLVAVPADASVGVGRSAESVITSQETTMETPNTGNPADTSAAGADQERKRSTEILAIAKQYAGRGLDELATKAIQNGQSVEQFRAAVIDKLASAPKPTAEIGMDQRDLKRYSLVRALNFLANPNDRRAREAASFELECSQAAAETRGKASQGLIIPFDILSRSLQQRDLNVGTTTAGGHLVETSLLSGSFIDLLRNAMVIDRLGTQMLTGLVGNIAIPGQSGAATAYWVTEGSAPTESQQTLRQVPMSPKTVGAFTDISRKLLLQSSIDVEGFVQRDLATVLGLAIQSVAIQGGGSNEPTGILATAGIGDVAGGTNGAAPNWANIVELETDVSVANADVGTLAYLTNARVRGRLKTTYEDGPGSGVRVWQNGSTPLNGYAAGVTNAVPSNLTKGTASGICSAIIFGNFADLIIGMWGGLDLMVDPYSNSTSGTVRVVALQDVDVAVRNAVSFSAMKDALTA
jgi:HK97 family phage major capsid protein